MVVSHMPAFPMPKLFRRSAALLVSSFVCLSGCHKGPQEGVVATVNGHPVLQTELDKSYKAQLNSNPQQAPSPDEVQARQLQVLQQLILEQMVEQRAAKENLVASDADVDAKFAEMKAPYTEEQFQARLAASSLTIDELKHEIRNSLTQNKLLNKEINSRITVTDADVTNYFNAHKAEYNLIEAKYHLAQIAVSGQANAQVNNLGNNKASGDAEARKKIQALKNRIDAGDDFGLLAQQFSERQDTAPNGGDMGFVSESEMKGDPATAAAVMKLKPGETSDIIPLIDPQTRKVQGYAIYKLLGKDAAGQRDLADPRVQQAIRQQLHDSRSQLLQAAYFAMLRDQSKVENYLAEQIFKEVAK
jgi:peptidyl-prolyl cis-trans isomerase SurA